MRQDIPAKLKKILEKCLQKDPQIVARTSAFAIKGMNLDVREIGLSFEFLDRAYEECDTLMPFIHVYTEFFVPQMSADPRFKSLLAKMKIAD